MATPEALLDRQSRLREALRVRVEGTLRRSWASLGSWNDADVDRLLAQVVPVVEAAQVQVAAITEVYLAELMSSLLGEGVAVAGVASGMTNLRPVPVDEVYRRPFVDHWTALKGGATFEVALGIGLNRLLRLGEDDLSLAHRRTALTVLSSEDRVTGFRRVVRPEIARSGSCGLCAAASTQIYKRDDLLPIHTRCNCDVMPIVRASSGQERDPGRRVNDADVAAIYKAAGSTKGKDLKEVRLAVSEHGELGPVLRNAGDRFTTEAETSAA